LQRFIMLAADSKGTSCLAVSPNRRWLAVAEQRPGKGTVTIYDLAILKKRKVLTPQEGGAKVRMRITAASAPQCRVYSTF
jgi:hypothetical protein